MCNACLYYSGRVHVCIYYYKVNTKNSTATLLWGIKLRMNTQQWGEFKMGWMTERQNPLPLSPMYSPVNLSYIPQWVSLSPKWVNWFRRHTAFTHMACTQYITASLRLCLGCVCAYLDLNMKPLTASTNPLEAIWTDTMSYLQQRTQTHESTTIRSLHVLLITLYIPAHKAHWK